MKRHKWSEPEKEYLKNNYYTKPIKEIAKKLGLKYQQVVSKASNMGMNKKKQTGETWTEKEDNFLKENFEYASKEFLEKNLPNRSWNGIYQRGRLTLGLNRKSQDKYYIDHNSFSKWNEHTAYIFGFLLADGYIQYKYSERNQSSIQIELADYDVDILEKIKKYTKFKGPIRKSNRNTAILHISNMKIIEDIISEGFPATNKTFGTKWIKTVPEELEHHFIRGLFDGDGSVYEKNGKMCIQFLGTEDIIQNIIKRAPSGKKNYYFRGKNGGANVYCLYYSSQKETLNIYDWMYKNATIFSNRKYQIFQDFLVAESKSHELLER